MWLLASILEILLTSCTYEASENVQHRLAWTSFSCLLDSLLSKKLILYETNGRAFN